MMIALSASGAFLLAGYECARSASTSLFQAAYGKENLPWVMAASPPALLAILWIYGVLLTRLGPRKTLAVTTFGSAFVFGGCYIALSAGGDWATIVLFVFREAYIVVVIEQLWALVNSTLSDKEARTLNGPFTGCASIGAIIGSEFVMAWATTIGSESMILVTAGLLAPTALVALLAFRFVDEPRPADVRPEKSGGHLALRHFFRNPVLLQIGGLVAVTQVASTLLDLQFHDAAADAIDDTDQRTALYGLLWSKINQLTFVLQFVVAPFILRRLSLRFIHLIIPLVHMLALLTFVLRPSLLTAAAAFLLFKSFDYSIFRAAKEVLYIPMSFDARYRCKAIIDMFGYRFSKSVSALGVKAFQWAAAGGASVGYAPAAMGALVGWVLLASAATRQSESATNASNNIPAEGE